MSTRIKITDEALTEKVKESFSVYDLLRKLNIKEAGGSHYHYSNRIKKLKLDTSHFIRNVAKGKPSPNRLTPEEILVLRVEGGRQKAKHLKNALVASGIKHQCNKCGQKPEWLGNPLTLDVDHINENWLDDRIDNLRFLCPNCHSQFSRNLLGG